MLDFDEFLDFLEYCGYCLVNSNEMEVPKERLQVAWLDYVEQLEEDFGPDYGT